MAGARTARAAAKAAKPRGGRVGKMKGGERMMLKAFRKTVPPGKLSEGAARPKRVGGLKATDG